MPDIAAIIRERALANGVDPGLLLRIGQVESSLDPNSRAKTSSATGLFQILTKGPNSEWAQYGQGGDPTDPVANADAGARIIADKTAALRSAGLDATPGNVYLAHFAGTTGATRLLSADPAAPASSVLSPAAIAANPFLSGMSVGDVRAWAGRKMGAPGDGSVSSTGAPAVAASAPPTGQQAQAPAGGSMGLAASGPALPPGLLNGGGAPPDLANDPNMQALLATAQSAMAPPPAPPLAPIQYPIPQAFRGRLLAAAQQPINPQAGLGSS